jgi:8-oxo-dGTP diphosphatase
VARFCTRCGSLLIARKDGEQERQVCPACGWVYYPKPSPASAVAILRDGRVLMVRRKYEPFAGRWTLPSGFMEFGEDPEQVAFRAHREALEKLRSTM